MIRGLLSIAVVAMALWPAPSGAQMRQGSAHLELLAGEEGDLVLRLEGPPDALYALLMGSTGDVPSTLLVAGSLPQSGRDEVLIHLPGPVEHGEGLRFELCIETGNGLQSIPVHLRGHVGTKLLGTRRPDVPERGANSGPGWLGAAVGGSILTGQPGLGGATTLPPSAGPTLGPAAGGPIPTIGTGGSYHGPGDVVPGGGLPLPPPPPLPSCLYSWSPGGLPYQLKLQWVRHDYGVDGPCGDFVPGYYITITVCCSPPGIGMQCTTTTMFMCAFDATCICLPDPCGVYGPTVCIKPAFDPDWGSALTGGCPTLYVGPPGTGGC